MSAAEAGRGSKGSNRRRRRHRRSPAENAADKQREADTSDLNAVVAAPTTEAPPALPEAAASAWPAPATFPHDAATDGGTGDAFDAANEETRTIDVASPPPAALELIPEWAPAPATAPPLNPSLLEIFCTVLFVLAMGALGGWIALRRRRR